MDFLVTLVLFLAVFALLGVIIIVLQDESAGEFDFNGLSARLEEIEAEELSEDIAPKDGEEPEEVPVDEEAPEVPVEETEQPSPEIEFGAEESELELPFEGINTFEPDPNQWSDLYREVNRYPWPSPNDSKQIDYDDRTSPEPPSESLREAIDWILEASTEAIHQREKYSEFIDALLPFIESPRADGAAAVAEAPWREKAANISRLLGERLLTIAFGLSCYGPREMEPHREALEVLLSKQWNADGLESPLLYQVIGRLGLLTPTETEDLQEILISRIPGAAPRSRGSEGQEELSEREQARYNSLLLAVSIGPAYPFPRAEEQLSRLWHWEESNPPLASWEYLTPVLYSLWIYHWINGKETEAVRDLAALLGGWWEDSPPDSDFFDENPATWEAILMCCWAWAPGHQMVWDKLRERYEALDFEASRIESITEAYFEWHEAYQETGESPPESFTLRRFPPADWLEPLPSEILDEASQPSFNFPEAWTEALGELEPPDIGALRDAKRSR